MRPCGPTGPDRRSGLAPSPDAPRSPSWAVSVQLAGLALIATLTVPYLLACVGEQAAAEDLLQEVYLAPLQASGRFRGRTEGEFIGWLLKIAHAKVMDRFRSRYRHPELKTSDVLPISVADPLDAIDQRLRLNEIADALSQLTEDQRNVLLNRLCSASTSKLIFSVSRR